MSSSDLYDIRSEFWKRHFDQAHDYDSYLRHSEPAQAAPWQEMQHALPPLTSPQKERLRGYNRKLNVLMSSGVWCGDCVRQGPMLHAIAQAAGSEVVLRIIDRDKSGALRDELRILGGARVPVVVFLSEDFFEIGRFGDRLLWAYRDRARGLVQACPTGIASPPADELAAEMADWVDLFERMLLMARLSGNLRRRHND